ncbi:DNA helicase INO80-like [Hibiscus syriacus]|uniref:DNA helicase INO80-like n=1 Tax=Hibiscus syriacus TaxID=106335 RepID=A0A6A2ZTT2_HIBSY|nr:DNA helicase INO80-like [Hibiscus syriacus]
MYSMGGLAEYCVVPAHGLCVLPKSLPYTESAILGCAVFTAYGAMRHAAEVCPGDSVAVIGIGGVGSRPFSAYAVLGHVVPLCPVYKNILSKLSENKIARAFGASEVIAVDIQNDKLQKAKTLGATHTVNAMEEDVIERVKVCTVYTKCKRWWKAVMIGLAKAGAVGKSDRVVRARARQDLPKLVKLAETGIFNLNSAGWRMNEILASGGGCRSGCPIVALAARDIAMEPVAQEIGQLSASQLVVNNGGTGRSYAATLIGGDASERPPFPELNEEEVVIQEGDVSVDQSGAYPVIQFSKRVRDSIDYNMRKTVIVRLLGKTIGYRALWNKINILWQPCGRFQLIDLDNDYFLTKAAANSKPDEVEKVGEQVSGENTDKGQDLYGPWMIAIGRKRRVPKAKEGVASSNQAGTSRFDVLNSLDYEVNGENTTPGLDIGKAGDIGISPKVVKTKGKSVVHETVSADRAPSTITGNSRNTFTNHQVKDSDVDRPVFVTVVYASPSISIHKHLWDQLKVLDAERDYPWLLGGDFNAILNLDEGSLFQRLDRCLANEGWLCFFPDTHVLHLDKLGSDHRSILMRIKPPLSSLTAPPFRFLLSWQDHPGFKDLLRFAWASDKDTWQNLDTLRTSLSVLNLNTFEDIGRRKRKLLARLRGIDNALSCRESDFLMELEKDLKEELELVLEHKENLWRQKSQCNWILDGDPNRRGMHLVKWEDLFCPEEIGGIEIKRIYVQNEEFLMKMAFRLIAEGSQLWARVLLKYKIKDLVPTELNRSSCSRLWKGLSVVWNNMRQNLVWTLRDGTSIDFWYDAWLGDLGPLVLHSECNASSGQLSSLVCSAARPPLFNAGSELLMLWAGIKIKSVASLCQVRLTLECRLRIRCCFTLGYSEVQGLPRVRMLLWTICKGRLLSNEECVRRHLSMDANCSLCGAPVESISYILRTVQWLWQHGRSHTISQYMMRTGIYCLGRWCGVWMRRNKLIFAMDFIASESVLQQSSRLTREAVRALVKRNLEKINRAPRVDRNGCWTASTATCFKLNTDGARQSSTGWAASGGLIRNYSSNWVTGFSKSIGFCSVLYAELWGIYIGLQLAWEWNIRKLIVETDSKEAISNSPLECNRVAGGLASMAWSQQSDFLIFDNPPAEVKDIRDNERNTGTAMQADSF